MFASSAHWNFKKKIDFRSSAFVAVALFLYQKGRKIVLWTLESVLDFTLNKQESLAFSIYSSVF